MELLKRRAPVVSRLGARLGVNALGLGVVEKVAIDLVLANLTFFLFKARLLIFSFFFAVAHIASFSLREAVQTRSTALGSKALITPVLVSVWAACTWRRPC